MRRGRIAIAIVALALLGALGAESAFANSPVYEFEAKPSSTQAGGHPDVYTYFSVGNRYTQNFPSLCFCESAKDIIVGTPPGVIGNPHAVPKCALTDFSVRNCTPDSQIGLIVVGIGGYEGTSGYLVTPLYNLEPRSGQSGLIGFKESILGTPTLQDVSARTESDYGLNVTVEGLTQFAAPHEVTQILWGVPADPVHDALRFPVGSIGTLCPTDTGYLDPSPFLFGEGAHLPPECSFNTPPFKPTKSNAPLKPFLSNPTTCGVPLESAIDTLAYDGGAAHASAAWPPTTGCDQLGFNPSLSAIPTTEATDTASGVDVKLDVPQGESPNVPSASEIKATRVTLPDGFSINSNAADGKTACSDQEAGFGTRKAAQCPEFAKVGTVDIESSALPGAISGGIYLGTPTPGERYRLIAAASGFGTSVKLAGRIDPDPESGRLTVSFEDLPQSPVTQLNMHFFGSERGILATPTRCGTFAVDSTFVPWDSALPDQTSTQFFTLRTGPNGSPCPGQNRPFAPGLRAGMGDNTAGAFAPFSLRVDRGDGDQNLAGVTVRTPPGFAASLRGTSYCPQSTIDRFADTSYLGVLEQASPLCPASSLVGTVIAGVGAGTHPLYNQGKVYLAGPYKGAPLSLIAVVPAVSGPYDLGNIAVRIALDVNRATAQVSAVSDPLPRIVAGIPLRIRSFLVNFDRPHFTFNPTDCDASAVNATVAGSEGGVATPSSAFQVANCAGLPYGPTLSLKLTGGLKRLGHPAIHAVLRANPGEANSREVVVTLPKGELLDNAHIGTVCTRVDFNRESCPAGSNIGTAQATTPLLDQPLRGSVYLRASNNKLPDLVIALKGQIDVEVSGRVDAVDGRLRTSFESIPDVPVSEFALDLQGGAKGLLQNSESLCGRTKRATVRMTGQNDGRLKARPKLQASCGKSAKPKKAAAGTRRASR